MIKRALISVSNKEGIVEFAKELKNLNIEILSTGGTAKLLRGAGIEVKDVSQITGFPECLDGRVKTLHPAVHGGILAIRNNKEHIKTLKNLNIQTIDLVVINLYPFKETISKEDVKLEEAIENIDIGGPAMLRAAAKNHNDVTVIIDPEDYDTIIEEIKNTGNTGMETRYNLALKVFEHTAHYDGLIADYLRTKAEKADIFPQNLTLTYEKIQNLRYGENPHQKAAFYKEIGKNKGALTSGEQLQGKELSFNNINDANGAIELLKEFEEPTVVAVKHTNPCGAASGEDIRSAWQKAYESDKLSIFGGIIAANRMVTAQMAKEMAEVFLEVIIAPGFTGEALEIFSEKKNLRLIKIEGLGFNCGQESHMGSEFNQEQKSHIGSEFNREQESHIESESDCGWESYIELDFNCEHDGHTGPDYNHKQGTHIEKDFNHGQESHAEPGFNHRRESHIKSDFNYGLRSYTEPNSNHKQESHTEPGFNCGSRLNIKKVQGGILIQEENNFLLKELKVVTDISPDKDQIEDLLFALRVVKHVKSNAVVLVRNKQTLAIGPGQTSRIWALQDAIKNSPHSLEGSVLASDAYFPFRDCVDEAAKAGVSAIIQPGGSIKDAESIKACNEHGISMVFTGMRHFKH